MADERDPSQAPYPYLNFLFRLTVGEREVAACSECTGLSLEVSTEDYHEGGENRFTWKLPVAGQVPNLVLKRGIVGDATELSTWFERYLEEGTVEYKDGEVALLASTDKNKKPARVWAFTGGFPVKWTGPDLNAIQAGVAFETLEIVHHGLRLKKGA
jgi:phage tail-like protein